MPCSNSEIGCYACETPGPIRRRRLARAASHCPNATSPAPAKTLGTLHDVPSQRLQALGVLSWTCQRVVREILPGGVQIRMSCGTGGATAKSVLQSGGSHIDWRDWRIRGLGCGSVAWRDSGGLSRGCIARCLFLEALLFTPRQHHDEHRTLACELQPLLSSSYTASIG